MRARRWSATSRRTRRTSTASTATRSPSTASIATPSSRASDPTATASRSRSRPRQPEKIGARHQLPKIGVRHLFFGNRCLARIFLPAALAAGVPLLEIAHQLLEVRDDRGSVDLARAREALERIGPRHRCTELEHLAEATPDRLVAVDRATVQRTVPARQLARGLMELELQDERQEVAQVRHVRRNVVLRAGVER